MARRSTAGPSRVPMTLRSRSSSGPRGRRPRWLVLLGLILVGAAALLWPRQLGGPATYVITRGLSMEPGIHTGDLVVARAADDYDIGDVVAIDSDELGITVLHRIVDRDGDRLVTKGDNNDWLDPERPRPDQLLGTMWLRIPAGGKALHALDSPPGRAGLATLALVGTGAGAKRLGRRSRRHRTAGPPKAVKMAPMVGPTQRRQLAAALALVAVVAGGVAALAWSTDSQRTAVVDLAFTHRGELSYHAAAPDSAVYDDGAVDTGEPVFLRVARRVTATFAYEADGLAEAPSGQISLAARVQGAGGWRRQVPLEPTRTFDDGTTEVTVDLDLGQLLAVADGIEEEIGVAPGRLTVTLLPVVTLDGEGLPAPPFDPEIAFQLDPQVFQPADGEAAASPGEPITVTEESSVPSSERTDNDLSFLGRDLPVATVRPVATGVAVVAAVLALAVLVWLRRSRLTEAERIAARFPGRIVTADHVDSTSLPTVDLSSIDDLARIAEREDRFILHVAASDEYVVHADTAVYRYATSRPGPAPERSARPDPVTAEGPVPPAPAPAGGDEVRFDDVTSLLGQPRPPAVPFRVDSSGTAEPDAAGAEPPGGDRT
jgi:signal peptidase I